MDNINPVKLSFVNRAWCVRIVDYTVHRRERHDLSPSTALSSVEIGSLAVGGCLPLVLQLDQRDKWRETPLHKAARTGNAGIVKALCTARMKVWMCGPLRNMAPRICRTEPPVVRIVC